MRRTLPALLPAAAAVSTLALAAPGLAEEAPAGAPAAPPVGPTEEVLVVTAPGAGDAVVAAAAEEAGGEVTADLATDGLAVVEVPAGGVEVLESLPGVLGVIDADAVLEPALNASVPLVGAPSQWSAGVDGAGQVVVVIDTGVDPANTAVAPALVGEACFAGFGTAVDNCRQPGGDGPLVASSTGALTATPCSQGAAGPYTAKCLHGTAVSATAVSRSGTRPGVARAAGLYAIQVFSATGSGATVADVLLALDHVVGLVDGGMEVAAVNLSLASPQSFPGFCDDLNAETRAYRAMFDELLARDVPVVVASGNSGAASATGAPACISNAVSVGATTLTDAIATFTNRSPALDLLAPGAGSTSGSGLTFPGVSSQAGTSFAAPHVSGALALVRQRFPRTSAIDRLNLLRRTGVSLSVPGVGSRSRLRLLPDLQALHAGVLFPSAAAVGGGSRAAVGDFDGDGLDDLLSHGPGGAPDRVSYGRSDAWRFTVRSHTVSGGYVPLAGNFLGAVDGPDDILWYGPGKAADSVWIGNPSRTFTTRSASVSGTYLPLLGDFDGDGRDDVFWYAPGKAADYVWYGGQDGFTSVAVGVSGTYRPVVGDFDGDGRDDVFWHGPGSVPDSLWRGTAGRTFQRNARSIGGSYLPLAGDFDGDGRDDILWYAPGSAADYIHYGGPGGTFTSVRVGASGQYQPFVADLDGDGRDDIVWYAPGPAGDSVWFGNPARTTSGRTFGVSGSYAPQVGDFDGDGADDIAWYAPATTDTPVWWSAAG